jgi:endoglucanase
MRRPLAVAATAVFVVAAVSGCVTGVAPSAEPSATPTTSSAPQSRSTNPFVDRQLFVWDGSAAAHAASADPEGGFGPIAETPTAIWLLPETYPAGEAATTVGELVATAERESALPTFVLYGIPDRDCGNFSSGGAPAAGYHDWVAAIAAALKAHDSVVILEPDALALGADCGDLDARIEQLRDAVSLLSDAGAAVYLDAGHSHWIGAERMAGLLNDVGTDDIRGFSLNVSNYNATVDERAYGDQVSSLIGGLSYVIDTSRNGNGSNGEWCNPDGRALGEEPHVVDDGSPLDAVLWIKAPGESDGACNGGPAAGVWWPEQALDLIAAR